MQNKKIDNVVNFLADEFADELENELISIEQLKNTTKIRFLNKEIELDDNLNVVSRNIIQTPEYTEEEREEVAYDYLKCISDFKEFFKTYSEKDGDVYYENFLLNFLNVEDQINLMRECGLIKHNLEDTEVINEVSNINQSLKTRVDN